MAPSISQDPIILVRVLRVKYGDLEVLHGLSFEVRRGETLVVMGGSGSGKSTTLRTLVWRRSRPVRCWSTESTFLRQPRERWMPYENVSAWLSRAEL